MNITVIKPAFELFEKTIGRTLARSQGPYRWCDYIVRTECEEGVLLWSTLSGALVLMPRRGNIHKPGVATPGEERKMNGSLEEATSFTTADVAALMSPLRGSGVEEDSVTPGFTRGLQMSALRALLSLGFLVPESFDEWKAAEQLRSLCGAFAKGEKREWGFTVFTTLACNARCPYCFEKGMQEQVEARDLNMSKATAERVAEFIADKAWAACPEGAKSTSPGCQPGGNGTPTNGSLEEATSLNRADNAALMSPLRGSEMGGDSATPGYTRGLQMEAPRASQDGSHSQAPQVRLSWFGGEPMVNPMAIETICAGLERRGVEWRSRMTSNGVLFDPELVRHAVERWRLEGIQITLDGREEEYNRVKGIRLCGGESAYGRVMRNIGLLAEAGVRVTVRLNLSLENAQELMLLAEELQPRSGVSVYCHPLFEYYQPGREAEADEVFARYKALNQRLAERGLLQPTAKLPSHFKLNHCEADSDTQLLILPDGSLGKCQNQHSLLSVGDIERGVSDPVRVAYFRQRQKSAARCRRCPQAPLCLLPECCDDRCGRLYLLKENDLISRQMRAELRRFRAGKGEGEENLFSCV